MVLTAQEIFVVGDVPGQRDFVTRAAKLGRLVKRFQHFVFVKRRLGFHHQRIQ